MAAELEHADLERYARARRGLLEHQRDALAGERGLHAMHLQLRRAIPQRGPPRGEDVAEREKPALHGFPAPSPSTPRRVATASSSCARSTMYGGANRTTLS